MLFFPEYELKMEPSEIRKRINIDKPLGSWMELGGTNCYAYALGLDVCELDIVRFAYQPGTIGRIAFDYYLTDIGKMSKEERMFLDFEALDIKYREADPEECVSHEDSKDTSSITYSWPIAFYETEANGIDFHFLRKDYNGVWSHKMGFSNLPSTTDAKGNEINDPRTCNLTTNKFSFKYVKTYMLSMNREK